jgi:phosphonate transport system substrate-binding protein
MHIAKSYDQGVQDIASEEVDFSRLGPASYVKAKDINSGLSILAVESEQGTKTFYGVICVRADSPIQDIAGLKGKSFAFADRNSTIGRYLSQLYLIEHGIKASDLAHYAYLGRHDKVGTAVGMGQFHAGALKENTFNTLVAKGVPIRAIAKFPNVTKPWVARSGLSQRVHGALREALLNLREASALKALGAEGFLEGQDEDYAATREAIHSEHLFEGPSPQVSLSVPSNEGHAGSQ